MLAGMRQQGVAARRSSKIDTSAGIKIAVPLACHYAGRRRYLTGSLGHHPAQVRAIGTG
jgi:hypothetical protein